MTEQMKKQKLLIGLALLVLATVGCGKKSANTPVAIPCEQAGTCPPTLIPPGISQLPEAPIGAVVENDEFPNGGTGDFVAKNNIVIRDFLQRPVNDVKNMKFNIDISDLGGGIYGGFIRVAYTENGIRVIDEMTSGLATYDSQHNKWFERDGKSIWHGFFHDNLGTIIVVIDDLIDLGDGGAADLVSGAVFYKNFGQTGAPPPFPGNCIYGVGCGDSRPWFVKRGPYSTRAFLIGDQIVTDSAVYPSNGFAELGRFSNVSLVDAGF